MRELIDRIRTEGRHVGGGIVKLDSFLNHQVDPELTRRMGEEFQRRFERVGVGAITRFEAQAFQVLIGGQTQTVSPDGQPRFHAMYEIESPDILSSPEWGEAVELGRWPEQVRPHTTNRRHTLLRLTYPE